MGNALAAEPFNNMDGMDGYVRATAVQLFTEVGLPDRYSYYLKKLQIEGARTSLIRHSFPLVTPPC